MTHEEKLRLVEELYDAAITGDFDRAATLLTDDFYVTEADSLPMAGVYHGRNALRDLFTKVMGMMDVAGLDVVETTIGEDHAITILSFRFQDPDLAPAHLLELFRFRGDKICEIRPSHFDPNQIIAACKAKAEASASA